ncbi:MAG: M56 family metallopeptidase [Pirellulales bacterium]
MTLIWGTVTNGVTSDVAWGALTDFASSVATGGTAVLGRMAWHATITFSILWVVERCWRSLPANHRCWLWRLAYLKVLLASLIPLAAWADWPLVGWQLSLPATESRTPISVSSMSVTGGSVATSDLFDEYVAHQRSAVDGAQAATNGLSWWDRLRGWSPGLILACWSIWLLLSITAGWREFSQLSRIRRRAKPVTDEVLMAEYRRLSRQFSVVRPPQLIQGPQRAGPLLLFGRRLAILLPQQFLAATSLNEQRMALAHELAHVVRRDLGWNMLAAVVQLGVGFLPVCWLAARRYRAAQEAASDSLAITRGRLVPRDYASLIVRTVNRHSAHRFDISTVALSQISPFATLTERIQAMQSNSLSRRRQLAALAFSLMCGLCALAPWAIAEESSTDAPQPAATETDSATADSDEKSAQDKSDKAKDKHKDKVKDKDKDKDKDKSAKEKGKSEQGESEKGKADSRKTRRENADRARYDSSDRYATERDSYVSERADKKARIGYSASATSGGQASGSAGGSGGNAGGSANVGGYSSVSVSSDDEEPTADRTESASDDYRRDSSDELPSRRERRRSVTMSGGGSASSGDQAAQVMRREEQTDGGRVVSVAVQEKGRSLQFRVSDDEGIEVTVVKVQTGPDDVMTVRAATADELKSQHPELFALYDKYVVKGNGRSSVRSIRRAIRSTDDRAADSIRSSDDNDELKRMIRQQLDELPEDAGQLRQLLEDQLREIERAE